MKIHRVILALALLCSGTAWAGSVTGTLTKISQTGPKAYYHSAGKPTGQPSCASGNPGVFVTDVTTPEGQAYSGKLNMGFSLGKTVTMEGTGTCSIDQSAETLKRLEVPQ